MKLLLSLPAVQPRRRVVVNRIEPLEPRIAPAAANLNLGSLDGIIGFTINGTTADELTGASVSDAGDVNGDGFGDLIIGAYGSTASYVVFGKASGFGTDLELSTLDGTNGFKLSGSLTRAVSGAGDVNGDGFDDLIIGAPEASPGGVLEAGASYVVFGKASGFAANLNLSSLNGTNGFSIRGALAEDFSGVSVSAAGDVNGDGFGDLIIGAHGADAHGSQTGESYIVFGKTGGFTASLNLSSLDGTNGFKLIGVAANNLAGLSVSGAGDVNGDGFDDIIIGANRATNRGASYVVFGKASGFAASLELSALDGTNGFKITGAHDREFSGESVSGAGDVNGDGFDDVIIGTFAATAYVVFGKSGGFAANLPLSEIDGTNGFKLAGFYGGFGRSVSSAGDINGDGFDDVIVGAYLADADFFASGASYVVFGKASGFTAQLSMSELDGSNGFRLSGAIFDSSGRSVSGAGDINNDGFDDLIIGARDADPNGSNSGVSYVVFGGQFVYVSDASVVEGNSGTVTMSFTVSLSTPATETVTLQYATADLIASALDDYTAISPTILTFEVGEITKTVSVTILGDTLPEANETLFLNLSSGTNATIIAPQGLGTIVDGDPLLAPTGKTATFFDADGEQVILKVSKGTLTADNFIFAPDGTLQEIDLKGDPRFNGANITITAKALGGGNGVVDVGFLNATGLDVGKVKVSGTLGMIVAGDNVLAKPAIKSLTVGSLGTTDLVTEPLVSEVAGSLGRLIVLGDLRGAALNVGGKLGKVTIGGDLMGDTDAGAVMFASIMEGRGIDPRVGGGTPVGAVSAAGGIASFTVKGSMNGGSVSSEGNIGSINVNQDLRGGAVAAAGQIKVVKVFGSLTSDDPAQPTLVAALAKIGSTKPAGAVAINQLTVNGDVENAQILLGYKKQVVDDQTSYLAKNPDASAGRVLVKGNWTASSLVAGVFDETGDGFGQNDVAIEGDTTTRILARIASIVIRGTATGSAAEGDHFAITAQQIGNLSIAGEKIALSKSKTEKDDYLLDEANGDFRVVEI